MCLWRVFAVCVFVLALCLRCGCVCVCVCLLLSGILLYGPPGTGKTLIARQIGKLLEAREPKIVNGPEVLNRYVGASEEAIRALFKDAEEDYKANGENADLHLIIFDEIDAICKSRGSTRDSTGVQDTIVNQLLSKIDGVNSLNNILVIGMTNRKDLLDEALLRPGRLEVHVEISLPDKNGRVQILQIHTRKMRESGRLDPEINFDELAELTKNFSGAEIEGLVRAAVSYALYTHVDPKKVHRVYLTSPFPSPYAYPYPLIIHSVYRDIAVDNYCVDRFNGDRRVQG